MKFACGPRPVASARQAAPNKTNILKERWRALGLGYGELMGHNCASASCSFLFSYEAIH